MATVTKCDICGKEGARPIETLVYKTFVYKAPAFTIESLDLCKDCMLKATNVHSVGAMCHEYRIESPIQKEESLASNEGWINIFEEDGKESPYISYRAYKTKEEALKKAEEYGGNGDYLKTIKIKW